MLNRDSEDVDLNETCRERKVAEVMYAIELRKTGRKREREWGRGKEKGERGENEREKDRERERG